MNAASPPVVMGFLAGHRTALDLAMREALRREASLRVVHAVWLPPAEARQLRGDELREAGQRVLDDARTMVEHAAVSPPTDYVLSPRPPVETLLSESREASVLVLGSDEVGWFDRLVGGEVTTFVARHAACPVLVVPEKTEGSTDSDEVVVALDVDGPPDEPLRCAFEQARLSRSTLRVLHAMPRGLDAAQRELADTAVFDGIARWKEKYPGVRVVTDIVQDDATDACLRASRRAEVLVVGRPRPVSLGLVREKPVAMRILRHASCPVLVARPARPG